MSVDLIGFVSRIPQDKLNEIVEGFTPGTTAEQIIEALGAAGIEASEEEAQALVASLLLKDDAAQIPDDDLEKVAGGAVKWTLYDCDGCIF